MNLQVLPLRMLAARKVVMERMDYSGHLNGKAKQELDMLDKLAGEYKVHASHLTIERFEGGEKISSEEWEHKRRTMPRALVNFLDGKSEFEIAEQINSGTRCWVISDVDDLRKEVMASKGGLEPRSGHWIHFDDFIEDGKLVTMRKAFGMAKCKMVLRVDLIDSFAVDRQGNILREFKWSMPTMDIKITKVMFALKELTTRPKT